MLTESWQSFKIKNKKIAWNKLWLITEVIQENQEIQEITEITNLLN
jgi:hypothetical protein